LKVVIIKLINGETLLGEYIDKDQVYISINRPLEVKMTPSVVGGQLVENPVISMYSQFAKEEVFDFRGDHILYCVEALSKIADFYIKTSDEMYNVDINAITIKDFEAGSEEEKKEGIDIDAVLQNSKKIMH